MRRLSKFVALSPGGRAIVLRSLLLLPVVAALLRARGFARTRAWLERMGPTIMVDPCAPTPEEISSLVGAAASLLRVRCLSRSLLLWRFLREQHARAEVRLGVSRLADGSLSGHAWVELDGLPLNDGQDVVLRYAAWPSSAFRFAAGNPNTHSL